MLKWARQFGISVSDAYRILATTLQGMSGGGGAPTDAQYLTLALNATLTQERRLVAGTNISLVDGGAGGDLTINGANQAPVGAQYLALATDATLTNERRMVAGTNISFVDGGAGGDLTVNGANQAPIGAQYLTLALDSTLTAERRLVAGTNIVITDGGANGDATIKASAGGSNGNGWGVVYDFTAPPASSGSTWVNQGSATVADDAKGNLMTVQAAAAHDLKILKKAAPATPWTITFSMLGRCLSTQNAHFGFVFRESSTGKLITWGWSAAIAIQNNRWTNPTTYEGTTPVNQGMASTAFLNFGQVPFLYVSDDGTNRRCGLGIGYDGQTKRELLSELRTTFITADEVGWYASASDASSNLYALLMSWKEA